MLSSEQQRDIRGELLKELSPGDKYGAAGLRLEFKQALVAVSRGAGVSDCDVQAIVASSGDEVFRDYAIGGAGRGVGLCALIRVYGTLRGPAAAAALRDRMQQLAEENTIRELS